MKTALILSLFLAATTAHAGGPVIVVEEAPLVSPRTEDGRVPGWVVPVAIGVLAIAILAGSDSCHGAPEVPAPSGC